MADSKRFAEIRVRDTAKGPAISVGVPKKATTKDVTKLLELISKEVLPGLVGCEACNSGVPIWIDPFDDIIRVDLKDFQRIG